MLCNAYNIKKGFQKLLDLITKQEGINLLHIHAKPFLQSLWREVLKRLLDLINM